ncbi:MAG: c-type cytochrome [Alphaproteobacteria bacterium]|nr:c-type cytochrome [Alphaproteobacteria bacterium]MBV8412392.1 c-type cytochrome [Alphaproteobacteria bacterium]
MRQPSRIARSPGGQGVVWSVVAIATMLGAWDALAQGRTGLAGQGERPSYASRAEELLAVPVTGILPGAVPPPENLKNPFDHDPAAIERGMQHFIAFNCVGCHAPNGAGGMGPALSNSKWLHGAEPANIFLSIYQGRSNGMPAWGSTLPPNVIWELVSYIQSISEDPDRVHFGQTISRQPQSPAIEQVPAQELQTATPWKHTEPISNGHKP